MILSGQTIRKLCHPPKFLDHQGMIKPFEERTKHEGMTFGIGPAGYDMRVEFDDTGFEKEMQLWPGMFRLASTMERFCMPNDVMGIVHDKSTWARRGLAVQNTVIEPGWEGWLTLELTNHGQEKITLKRGMPICQVVFHRVDQPVEKSYDGKYHNQARGPVEAIHDK
jgi:dCTP deaminase